MPQVVDLRKIKKNAKKNKPRADEKIRIRIEKSQPKKPKAEQLQTEKPDSSTDKQQTTGPIKIEWTAPEFKKYKKGKKWFILPSLFALTIVIIAIILKNFLFAIMAIIAAFVVYLYAKKEPRKIKFSISGKGIQVDNQIYEFEDLKSFWIFYKPPEVKEISIRSKKAFIPYIKIPLENQNPVEIRRLLLRFLPERKHSESVIDEWARRVRI